MGEEIAFPRGGGRTLTGLERKRLRQEAEAEAGRDFLAELHGPRVAKRARSDKVRLTDGPADLCYASCSVSARPSAVYIYRLLCWPMLGLSQGSTQKDAGQAPIGLSKLAACKHCCRQLTLLTVTRYFCYTVWQD